MSPLSALSSTPVPAASRVGPIDRRTDGAQPRRPGEPESVDRPTDQVELSAAARQLLSSDQTTVRTDLVNRVREEIRAGTYETPEKIDIAVRRAVREVDLQA